MVRCYTTSFFFFLIFFLSLFIFLVDSSVLCTELIDYHIQSIDKPNEARVHHRRPRTSSKVPQPLSIDECMHTADLPPSLVQPGRPSDDTYSGNSVGPPAQNPTDPQPVSQSAPRRKYPVLGTVSCRPVAPHPQPRSNGSFSAALTGALFIPSILHKARRIFTSGRLWWIATSYGTHCHQLLGLATGPDTYGR